MTLRRQATWLAWGAVFAVLFVITVTLLGVTEMRQRGHQITRTEENAKHIGSLRYLIMEAAFFQSQRSNLQWAGLLKEFRATLGARESGEPAEAILVRRQVARLDSIERLHDDLLAAQMGGSSAATPALINAMFLASTDMSADAFELLRIHREAMDVARTRFAAIVLFNVALLVSLIAAGYLILRKRVLGPVAALGAAISAMAAGDLRQRVDLTLNNEIGVLAGNFDAMAARLEASISTTEREVAQRRAAQQQLERLVVELEAARDLAESANLAKGQFLANMSHELRTPMNGILGMLQLLRYTSLSAMQQDYVVKTVGAANSLLALLNDILDFSRINADKVVLERAPFEPDAVLQELALMLSALLGEKEIELLYRVDPALPPVVVGDALRLRQVLLNLAGNALKFTAHGEVCITLAVVGSDEAQVTVEFSVRDTGIGIAPERLEHIFDQFEQAEASTSRRFGGTGLGLAISRRLVQLMGGDLAVSSRPGEGSLFQFRVSFDRAPAVGTPPPAHRKVLVVDDNQSARSALQGMVGSLGWECAAVADGPAALALLAGCHTPFDVILVDWRMPGMDGWELIHQVRSLQGAAQGALVIMVSGRGRAELAQRGAEEREWINGYLTKPVTSAMLLDAVMDATAPCAPSAVGASAIHASRLAGLHLLVVDDNPMNLQVARELLAHEGASVQTATGGEAAIALLSGLPCAVDAVLMDIQMPDMDGHAVARYLRTLPATASLPIIAMTANAMESDRARSLAAGMDDHLSKPIDLERLVATLLRHCRPDQARAAPVAAPARADQHQAVLDVDGALQRLGGNHALYLLLREAFHAEWTAVGVALGDELARGNWAAAADRLHAFKSAAATVGAARLQHYSAELEQQLRGANPVSAATVMDELEALAAQASACLDMVRFDAAAPIPAPAQAQDGDALLPLLEELAGHLERQSMDALSCAERLTLLSNDSRRMQALERCLSALDFDAALSEVRCWREALA
jgi:two-component system sensor histidine kinase/response regulator